MAQKVQKTILEREGEIAYENSRYFNGKGS
jgi:hypothetical protein